MLTTLRGVTALITGASAGIGREFARQLAPVAHTLILVARREDLLEELETQLRASGGPGLNIFTRKCDLAVAKQRQELVKWLSDNDFPVNLLINNAGLGDVGNFASAEWGRINSQLQVNIHALTYLTHALLPVLRAQPQAAILNVSSTASYLPIPNFAVYAATKAYVTSFSEAIRHELLDTSVSVTALCPGPVETEFGDVARREGEEFDLAPDSFYVSVEKVATDALRGVLLNRARVIPGWQVAVVITILGLLPIPILRFLFRLGLAKKDHEKPTGE